MEYWYIIVAVIIVIICVFLYMSLPADDGDDESPVPAAVKSPKEAKKVDDLIVSNDIDKAREIVQDDIYIFERMQEMDQVGSQVEDFDTSHITHALNKNNGKYKL